MYDTIELAKILAAAEQVRRWSRFSVRGYQDLTESVQDGVFHENMFLHLSLTSPHFKSGKPQEDFELILMRHKETGILNLAIDEFPEMSDEAVESFWRRSVDAHTRYREAVFQEWERNETSASAGASEDRLHTRHADSRRYGEKDEL